MANKKIKKKPDEKMGNGAKNVKAKPKKEKEKLTRKQIIIIIAVTVVSVIISGIIIGAVALSKGSNNPNLLKADLTKYIEISAEDYKGIDLDIPLDDTSDAAVQKIVDRKINMLLTNYKTLNEQLNGAYDKARPLSVGDTVYIYYRGYTVDENGRQKDFEGSSNIPNEMTVLEVGTGKIIDESTGSSDGSFIPGFGESLVGIVPGAYSVIDKIRQSDVQAGDVVYLTYSVIGEDGNSELIENERIDLSLSYIDELYGDGFSAYLIGKTIGQDLDPLTVRKSGHSTDTVYSDMKVSFVTRGTEATPITIQVKFPANYGEESLRGVDAYFDVFVSSASSYDVPEFDDTLLTEKVKVRASDYSSYPGSTLAERYKAKVFADTKEEIEDTNTQLLTNKMWDHLMSKVKIIKLPKKTLESYYDSYYSRIVSLHNSGYYSQYYETLDELAVAYLNETYGMGLSSNSDWKGAIQELAEWDLTQNLVFYYIIREENILPTDEEYASIREILYNDILDYYIESNSEKFANLDDAAYKTELDVLKSEINDYYTEDYFEEEVYRYYGTRKIIEMNTKK